MKMKKLLAVFMAASMMAAVVGCGQAADSGNVSDSKEETATKEETESPAESASVAEDEDAGEASDASGSAGDAADGNYGELVAMADAGDPITYTYFVRDAGQDPADDNPVINKIQELTGVTIDFEFLVGDLDQKIGVMIAGGDYPDLIFAGDAAPKFMDAGAAIPLEDYIPKYPNLMKWFGPSMKYLEQADGHIYGLPIYGWFTNELTDAPPIFECGIGFYMQKAVLADAGYPEVRTLDDYFALIEDYMEKNPEIDGVKTMGFEMLADGWRNWSLLNPAQNLLGVSNEGNIFVNQDTLETSFYQISDTAHNFYKKLNEEYQNGVIRAESLTQSYDEYIANITTGAVLGFFDQNWNFQSANNLLKADGKFDRTYVALPITDPGVKDGYIDGANGLPSANNSVMISVNCENPERILAYFDWMLQREVQDYLQWGEEGTDWNYTEGQDSKVLTAERRAISQDTEKNRDQTGATLLSYSPAVEGIYKEDGMPATAGNSAAEYLAAQGEFDQKFLKGYNIEYPAEMHSDPVVRKAYYPVWGMSLEDGSAAAVTNEKIVDVCSKNFAKMILAKDEAEYESLWESYLKEFNALDLESYQTEIDRQIAEKMAK